MRAPAFLARRSDLASIVEWVVARCVVLTGEIEVEVDHHFDTSPSTIIPCSAPSSSSRWRSSE
jgi:hypothetical protein